VNPQVFYFKEFRIVLGGVGFLVGCLTLQLGAQERKIFGGPVLQQITERITINADGTCDVHLTMVIPPSPFAILYRQFLGFKADIPALNAIDVPETVSIEGVTRLKHEAGVRLTRSVDTATEVPVRRQLIDGVVDQHRHEFGIELSASNTTKMWGVFGSCVFEYRGSGTLQADAQGALIGPQDRDTSFERIGFLLMQMEQIKAMLRSPDFAVENEFRQEWTVTFEMPAPITNQDELRNKNWSQ